MTALFLAAALSTATLDTVVVYPNPFKPNDGRDRTGTEATGIVFADLPAGARIEVFSARGDRVFAADVPGGGDFRWRVETDRRKPVASGLYLYVVTFGSERRTGRLAVMR